MEGTPPLCTRAILLDHGRVAFVGTGGEVAAQYMHRLAPRQGDDAHGEPTSP
jgi:ABC-type polysaccharide/polyol phosphate transport system ATPase subunit